MKKQKGKRVNQNRQPMANVPGREGVDTRMNSIMGIAVSIWLGAASAGLAETRYPLLAPRNAYAHARHVGECAVGSVGTINKYASVSTVIYEPVFTGSGAGTTGALRFRYSFRHADGEEWGGLWFSCGRTAIGTINSDGTAGPDINLSSYGTLDLNDLFLDHGLTDVAIEALRMVLLPNGANQVLTIKVELTDSAGRRAYKRIPFDCRGAAPVEIRLDLDGFKGTLDRSSLKLIALVIEERHVLDGVVNPSSGGFSIAGLELIDVNGPDYGVSTLLGLNDRDFLLAIGRREFEALRRIADPVTGLPADRTLFPDLLHIGAAGWVLATLPSAVEFGWISAADARGWALKLLRFAARDDLYGNDAAGKIGNSIGLLYRFGGIDSTGLAGPLTGTRKIDLDNVNAVEVSVIDTALFQMGAIVCAQGFTSTDPADVEIRGLVQTILDRTRWEQVIDPATAQARMAWKPTAQTIGPGYFATPASFGGFWASRNAAGDVLTIDYSTDEGRLVALLAIGSRTHPVSTEVWYRMIRRKGPGVGSDVVVTWPGAAFTYLFGAAVYFDPNWGLDRGQEHGTVAVDWVKNARLAVQGFKALSPAGELKLVDAVELQDATYIAQGLAPLAADPAPRDAGVRTPYSLELAVGLGGTSAPLAVTELRRILAEYPDLWHPLWGLLDAYHPDLASIQQTNALLRTEGRWVQQQVFSLNKGAALCALLNYLGDGAIWRAASGHPVVSDAVRRIYREARIPESGSFSTPGGGHDYWAVARSGDLTLLADCYQESLVICDAQRRLVKSITRTELSEALSAAGQWVEQSSGPAGVRAVTAHPDGGWVVLMAGPGTDVLLRVTATGDATVLASAFGEAMTRGDEIWNYPRLAMGGSPSSILVSVRSPIAGAAVLQPDGSLLHRIAVPGYVFGLAAVPGSACAYALNDQGRIYRLADVRNAGTTSEWVATLPVAGRDLAYNPGWRTARPNLVAAGSDGKLYIVELDDFSVRGLDLPFATGVVALQMAGDSLVIARNESAYQDDFGEADRTVRFNSLRLVAPDSLELVVSGVPGMRYEIHSAPTPAGPWTPAERVSLTSTGGAIHLTPPTATAFFRASEDRL